MSRYQAYPEYKDSGVEWLEGVPSQWQLTRIKYIAELTPKKPNIDRNLECSFVPMEKLKTNSVILDEVRLVNDVYDGYTCFRDGDILMAKVTPCFENKNIAIAEGLINKIGFGSSEIYVIRTNELAINRYWYYRLQEDSFMDIATAAMTGAGGLRRVPSDVVSNFTAALPSEDEQLNIANFLDHETAKIDTLIEQQQQLIRLLKEKRQAVISHAVTKGLNPNAPMKDSGVEWLGEVPEHWVVKRLKHISPKIGVGLVINPSTYTKDEGVYFIFGGDVKEYGFDLSNTRHIAPEDSDKLLPSRLNHRDLISVRVGYPGITAVVTEDLEGANCASVIVIRKGRYNSDWLCASMNSWVGRQQVELVSYGAAQKQFNVADAIDFIFPVPPSEEQNEIASFVEKALDRFDVLSKKADKQIELLQERRTALISATVTGKIDVRNWQSAAKN